MTMTTEYELSQKYHDLWPTISKAVCSGLNLENTYVSVAVEIKEDFLFEVFLMRLAYRLCDAMPDLKCEVSRETSEVYIVLPLSMIRSVCTFDEVKQVSMAMSFRRRMRCSG